jgi:DNA-binding response OmpR family regulator
MDSRTNKVLVVETDTALRERVAAIVRNAGFQVFATPLATLNNVLEFSPDVIVMAANPPELDCCDLLADVRGSEQARSTRVIMLAAGVC